MHRLQSFLYPQSIAVIGASRKDGSLGKMFLTAIQRMNYKGDILPVNPKAESIDGLNVYPSIDKLPQKPDLAVILLPQKFVLNTVEELGQSDIRNIIVISAGFKELGQEGIEREKQLIALKERFNLNILGPNCMGIFNTHKDVLLNGTFSPTLPQPGHIAYISQSGALGVAILELAQQTDLGFSAFVSTGNKADISDTEVIEFLKDDNNTHVITLYLESVDYPPHFMNICRETAKIKPVLALKAGRTKSGLKAASSHTGALANPEYIMDGFFKQSGVIRKNNLQEMFEAARALAKQPLPKDNRTVVITNAGGPGILASDMIEDEGLQLAELTPQIQKKLTEILPEEASVKNPIDMIAGADHKTYEQVAELVLNEEYVDSVILIIVKPPVQTTPKEIVDAISPLAQNCGKTIIATLMAAKDNNSGLKQFIDAGIPVFDYPESAVKALSTMWQYQNIQQRMRKSDAIVVTPHSDYPQTNELKQNNTQAPVRELLEMLRAYSLEIPAYRIDNSLDGLLDFMQKHKRPFALKIANQEIVHKSDLGLLQLNINTPEQMTSAFNAIKDIAKRDILGNNEPQFLVQEQLSPSVELVIGGKRDPQFGPIVMAGIGGVFVEILKDVTFRLAPVNVSEAGMMLQELKAQAMLNGARGNPVVDRRKLSFAISQFSLLMAEHPEIIEMDLNPLIWSAENQVPVAVDVRATVTTK
ncbi:MAG: hypothetical protein GF313_12655 [Caldithrix sp.]|nr:hypothetical protein [Caldithrix sp.]